jgi:hypothetical protein
MGTTGAAAERILFIAFSSPKLFGPLSWFIGAYCTAKTSSGQLGASTPNCLAYEAGSEGFPSCMLLIAGRAQVLID